MEFFIGEYLTKILFLIFAISLIYNFNIIKKPFLKIKRKTWAILIIIILSGLVMRIILPPNELIVADEYANMNMAQNFIYTNEFGECYKGSQEKCGDIQHNIANQRLHGFQTIMSISFLVFGIEHSVASNLNMVFSILSLFMIFILLQLLFKREKLSLWGAFLFALLPIHIILSSTVNLALSSVFFIILSFCCIILLLELKEFSVFIFSVLSFLIMVQIRPENFIFGIIILIYFFVMGGWSILSKFGTRKIFIIIILALIFLIPFFQIFHYGFFEIETYWDSDTATKIQLLKENLLDNFIFWIRPSFNATLFPFLVVAGFVQLFRKNKLLTSTLILFLLAGLGVYSSFFIGKFSDFGYRYTVILYLPLIIFASYEVDYFLGKEKYKKTISILFTALFIISLASAIPYMAFSEYKDAKEFSFIKASDDLWSHEAVIISRPSKIVSRIKEAQTITPHEFIFSDNRPEKLYFVAELDWHQNIHEDIKNLIMEKINEEYALEIIQQQAIDYTIVDEYHAYNLTIIKLTKK